MSVVVMVTSSILPEAYIQAFFIYIPLEGADMKLSLSPSICPTCTE
jgi:hypothetical protein